MIVREAKLEDYEAVSPILVEVELHHVDIEPEVFRPIETYDYSHYTALINGGNSIILLAEENGQIFGVLIEVIGEWPALDIFQGGRYAVVQELSVTKSAHRKGIGKLLMQAAEEWAQQKGVDRLQLSVWHRNSGAIAFYESLGYTPYLHNFQKKFDV